MKFSPVFKGLPPFSQLIVTLGVILVVSYVVLFLGMLLMNPIFGSHYSLDQLKFLDTNDPNVINVLKYMQMLQSLAVFILPSLIVAKLFEGSVPHYLQMNHRFKPQLLLIAFVLIIVANPFINLLGSLNEAMKLPDWLSGVEEKMRSMEDTLDTMIEKYMDVKTFGALLFNVFLIAVLPALGEEFLFRGVLQKIFTIWTKNYHWGIWITAAIFSTLHMQFYGFVPRLLLGVMFGYMLVWSGSIWVPVVAHFVNNAVGVISMFYIKQGGINPKVENIGSTVEQLPIALLSILLVVFFGTLFYRNRTLPIINTSQTIDSE